MTTLAAIGCFLLAAPAYASEGGGHADPVASVALWLVVILLAAKLGGDLAVRMGQPAVLGEIDLRSFAQPGVLGLAAALTLVAIVGKQACSLGVLGKDVDRLTVGIGMVPRGEVGLIFANIGLALSIGDRRIIDEATFSAIVVMVIMTTMVAPPALKWSLGRRR